MISLIFERDISDNFLMRLAPLYGGLRGSVAIWKNASWFIAAAYQALSTLAVARALTGEAFENSMGRDMGGQFLGLNVYIAIIVLTSCYLLMLINMMTYYSIMAVFGTMLGMIATLAWFQSYSTGGDLDWRGFYGESFSVSGTLLMIVTVVLAGCVPTHVTMLLWGEAYKREVVQVVEIETDAAITDEPVFYDPPTSQTAKRRSLDSQGERKPTPSGPRSRFPSSRSGLSQSARLTKPRPAPSQFDGGATGE
jgi:hypothetical protein